MEHRPDKPATNDNKKKIKFLTQELVQDAMTQLRIWQADHKAPLLCPHCGADGLTIIDRSSRPHAEWYAFRCKVCGLDDAIQIPMSSHRPPA